MANDLMLCGYCGHGGPVDPLRERRCPNCGTRFARNGLEQRLLRQYAAGERDDRMVVECAATLEAPFARTAAVAAQARGR